MSTLALRYERKDAGRSIAVSVPAGAVSRIYLPDRESKARLVTAVLKAKPASGEELELLGEPAGALKAPARERLRRRVAGLTPVVGLVSNLNAWENISLPAAYHGRPALDEVARITLSVLESFGAEPRSFLARLPDELGALEKRIAAFARLLVAAPDVALIDDPEEGLTRQERARVAGFEAEFRKRLPQSTLVFLETREEEDG